jgi:D-alanyl-D-alanine carboxypeptidase/D-alanyl-D-alanine-endopeptidase (penicillin-binding protein 4)
MRTAAVRSRRAGLKVCCPILVVAVLTACHTSRPAVRPADRPSRSVVQLRHDIDTVLAAPALASSFWGVVVRSLKTDETIYALNPNKLLMPASNMKIVTLAAAADRLGWDFTYETRVLAVGPIDGGTLNGDLLVVGTGDPSLDDWDGTATRLFESWADQLKVRGVSAITGRIIGDDRAFADDGLGFGWSWDDLGASFAARVSALQFNEGSAQVTIVPGTAVGDPATITVTPVTSGLVIRNIVNTADRTSMPVVDRRRLPGRGGIELRGAVPLGGRPIVQTVAVDNPTLFFVSALKAALVARGIDVAGPAIDIEDLPTVPSPNSVPLITYRSPPLAALSATLMKLSQNQFAEALLRTLGASEGQATADGGRGVAQRILQGWGIAPAGLIQVDGSGLSRYNYVTSENLVAILSHIDRDDRLRAFYEAALPVAGADGTLALRLKGSVADGKVRAKDGSMAGVRALSGYVTTADSEPFVFSILANNFEGPPSVVMNAMDAIAIKLAEFMR